MRGRSAPRGRLLFCLLVVFALCAVLRAAPEDDESFYNDNEVQLDIEPDVEATDPSEPVIEVDESAEAVVDENGNVISEEPQYDEDGNLIDPGSEEESQPNPEDQLHHDDYIIDEVQTEEDVRARLVLDEITEYYDEEGVTWYKIQVHMQNIGEVPICAVTVEISNKSHVEEAWTLSPIAETENLYELLWCYNVSFAQTRFFGLITQGKEVPDISFYSVLSCNTTEAADADATEETEPEEDPNAPVSDDPAAAAATDKEDGTGLDEEVEQLRRRRRLKEEQVEEDAKESEVTLEVDEMAEHVQLSIDEVQEMGNAPGQRRQVLVNAHVTNNAAYAICHIKIWIYGAHRATRLWGINAEPSTGVGDSDIVHLPSARSELQPSQSHFFGFVMQLEEDYPNLAVVTAERCQGGGDAPPSPPSPE